jgi:glycosyltransferase involved in cell wall biosynthesis
MATVGRAALAARIVDLLADQTRPPDAIVVVGADPADVTGIEAARGNPVVLLAQRGLCRQRNAAMAAIRSEAQQPDIVLFIDDDFVPAPDYLANLEHLFTNHADVVGVTGELVSDGIHHHGHTLEEAQALIAARAAAMPPAIRPRQALYGCNMAFRLASTQGLTFDEALPLYGWQEDIDFTYQLARRGRLISTGLVTGVHMGTKGGRTSGRKMGYSQIANLVYLWRKGTMQPGLGEKLLRQNLLANLVKSVRPEPHIDRRGRLIGNMLAIRDWATGRIDPRRIETM